MGGRALNIQIRDIITADLPSLDLWLNAEHVRRVWGEPQGNLRLLSAPPAAGHWRAIIEADRRAVGLVMWQHPGREELNVAGLTDIPTSVIDIDIMIGERDAIGLGIGSGALHLVAELALADPEVPFVMGCVQVDNLASLAAFGKAGFCRQREFDDVPYGLHVLMVRHRPGPAELNTSLQKMGGLMFDLEGKVFRSLTNTDNGEVGAETLFFYHQQGRLVWADYQGGRILRGHLIAQVLANGQLDMRYHHLNEAGEFMLGRCVSTPQWLPDGRLRFNEAWQWLSGDGSSGQSVIEELNAPTPGVHADVTPPGD